MILSKSQAVAKAEHMIPLRYSRTLCMHSHEELPSIHNIEENNDSDCPQHRPADACKPISEAALQAKQDIIYGSLGPCCFDSIAKFSIHELSCSCS